MKPKRFVALLAGAVLATTGALVGVQLVGVPAANAVTGLVKVNGQTSPIDSQPTKTARANCPAGTRVIGGGGWVNPMTTADTAKVVLVELQPVHPATGPDFYVATGQEVTPNITSNWWVQAYAICASPVSGMHTVTQTSTVGAFAAHSLCPPGENPLGGGGRVNNPANHVALVMVTPFADGGRIVAEAMPDSPSYTGVFTVTSYAVCAPTPPGYEIAFKPSVGLPNDTTKVQFARCPAGKRVHSAAAAIRADVPTGVGLQVAYPSNALDEVEAVAVRTSPAPFDWNPVVAVAICAF
jgi:hypothetical protein